MSLPSSETPATEQVITEIFAKSLHIILESRSPYVSSRNYSLDQISSSPSSSCGSPSPGRSRSRDKWFNLALRECPAALENSDFWRQSNLEPLVIDILLVNRVTGTEKLLERWVVQYETRKQPGLGRKSKRNYYRGATLMFRSLYLLVRLLPAYNLFRDINCSGRVRPLGLLHKIQPFVNPLTRSEEAEMRHLSLAPVETPSGRLSQSVSYLPVIDDINIGSEPTTPLSTELIPDYVGSPTTDPLKRFQTLPVGGTAPILVQTGRRHSWSTDRWGAPNLIPSSLPAYSDQHPLSYKERPSVPLLPSEAQRRKKVPEDYQPFLASSLDKATFRYDSVPFSRGSAARGNPYFMPAKGSDNNELVRFGELFTQTSLLKELSIGGDDIQCLEGLKFSLGSGSWVHGSKVLSPDWNEDTDGNYPFVPDAIKNSAPKYEVESSQGAIVGGILRMLKTAPKLQSGDEKSDSPNQNPNPATSGFRTAADALHELRNYMHLRDSILSQSGAHQSELSSEKGPKHEEETNYGKEVEERKFH